MVRLVFASLVLLAALASEADVIAVWAGQLIDPESARVLTQQTIVIRDGIIESVGPGASVPPGARVIDLTAYTVLPGLIDSHSHLIGDARSPDPLLELQHTAAQTTLLSLPNARAVLMSGFTTVRDLGTYRALLDVAMRDAIDRGDVVGPRMYVVGAYITITGGAGAMTGMAPDVTLPWDMRYGNANTPDEVRERVRALAGQGVDLIKMLATGAVLTHGSNLNARESTRAELDAAVDEARNFGLKVAAHAHSPEGIKNAIRAGVASIEHGTLMDDEARALMKQKGTYLVPTLEAFVCINRGGFPPDFVAHLQKIGTQQLENFRKAVAAGVKIAFGTDSGVCPYTKNAEEFGFMVDNGMTPMQAIQAATVSAADLLGRSDRLGSIRPGKFADIIAVRHDPLANIRELEDVRFVMKQGVVYKAD